MLPRQLPCYDLQRLRNLFAALAMAAPAFQTPYTFLGPNKTSDSVARHRGPFHWVGRKDDGISPT